MSDAELRASAASIVEQIENHICSILSDVRSDPSDENIRKLANARRCSELAGALYSHHISPDIIETLTFYHDCAVDGGSPE